MLVFYPKFRSRSQIGPKDNTESTALQYYSKYSTLCVSTEEQFKIRLHVPPLSDIHRSFTTPQS